MFDTKPIEIKVDLVNRYGEEAIALIKEFASEYERNNASTARLAKIAYELVRRNIDGGDIVWALRDHGVFVSRSYISMLASTERYARAHDMDNLIQEIGIAKAYKLYTIHPDPDDLPQLIERAKGMTAQEFSRMLDDVYERRSGFETIRLPKTVTDRAKEAMARIATLWSPVTWSQYIEIASDFISSMPEDTLRIALRIQHGEATQEEYEAFDDRQQEGKYDG